MCDPVENILIKVWAAIKAAQFFIQFVFVLVASISI